MSGEEQAERARRSGDGLLLPAPTPAPMLFALGLSLIFAGLVTHWLVASTGFFLGLAGAYAWWRQVLPNERHVRIPLQGPEERARPVEVRLGAVDHLHLGEAGHRVRLPADMPPYAAGLRGGVAGGVAMALVATAWSVSALA